MTYATIGRRAQRISQVAFLRLHYRRGTPTSSKRRRSGTWTSRPPSPRRSSKTASSRGMPPRRVCPRRPLDSARGSKWQREDRDRDDAAGADPGVRCAESRIPTTSDTSRCLAPRSSRRCSASRCRSSARTRRPARDRRRAMICTFGDVTDVIWWRALSLPVRAIISRTARCARSRGARPDGNRPTFSRSGPTTSWPTCRP